MKRKKNAKKAGIKIKTNYNNYIYFFNNDDFKKQSKNYLLLEDDSQKLIEKENNTEFKFIDRDTNKTINLTYKKYNIFFDNQYTIDKNNIINKALLKKYCGNDKVPSNILIQIIHNNEDIKKILSLYINEVIFTLSSLTPNSNRECISKISESYHIKDNKIITSQGEYRNKDLYEIIDTLKTRNFIYGFSNTKKETIFEYLKTISLLRNKISHFDQSSNYHSTLLRQELSNYLNQKGKEFLNNSKLNIELITKLYSSHNVEKEIKKYYLYILDEGNKSLGISIKKIMEQARKIYPSNLPEEENKKYNILLKYHLFNYLSENTKLSNKYIELLRSADFEDKESIYENIVKEIGYNEFNRVKIVCTDINYKNKAFISKDIINDILNVNYDWNDFTLEVYALSKFLTTKETNILVSSLINKSESILDLLKVGNELGLDTSSYIQQKNLMCELSKIEEVVKQLKIVNSSKKYINIKKAKTNYDVMISGLNIFKNDYTNEQLKGFLDENACNFDAIFRKKRIKNPIKNFIRNNVIKSKEFNYIFRYTNTKNVSALLYHNPKLIRFLLNSLTDEEKEKYQKLNVNENTIANITLDSVISSLETGNIIYTNNIKIYLKCIHFLVKNMININSYYYIAFSFYDRDMKLVYGENIDTKDNNFFSTKLSELITHKGDLEQTKKTLDNFQELEKDDINLIRLYRNKVEHININEIMFNTKFPDNFEYKNYFKIYHYCMENDLLQNEICCDFLKKCKNNIESYGKYSKNLLYVLNAIFMYNYARYKDISDETIFMRKYEN